MEMGAVGQAGRADITDDLTLFEPLDLADALFRQSPWGENPPAERRGPAMARGLPGPWPGRPPSRFPAKGGNKGNFAAEILTE